MSAQDILNKLLVCPRCQGQLTSEPDRYRCRACDRQYPIVEGIPRFVEDLSQDEHQVQQSFDHEHWRYRESRYLHFTPDLVRQWLEDIQLPAEWFHGKLVLDAGCGSGRWTYAMASLGATVIAVDLTNAGATVTFQATREFNRVAVIQASLFDLPLRSESFDLVVSWGVLHHTPDTLAAFKKVAPLVKRGGQLYVMVYERHNPVKFFVTDLLRRCLRWLPEHLRYKACRALVIRHGWLYSKLSKIMICAPYPTSGDPLEVSTMQFGLYDAYAPVYNHLHTHEEVASWFRSCGFTDLVLTKPIRYTQPADVYACGHCGGAVHTRGVRA